MWIAEQQPMGAPRMQELAAALQTLLKTISCSLFYCLHKNRGLFPHDCHNYGVLMNVSPACAEQSFLECIMVSLSA
jgi:hypothetical protein